MYLIKILFLSEPARFVTKLKDISIPMRQKLRLECTFKGAPKMFVTWYKNGKQLYASYRYNTKVTGDSCTVECLHECNKDTPGTYACEVSNSYGTEICYANISVITGQFCYANISVITGQSTVSREDFLKKMVTIMRCGMGNAWMHEAHFSNSDCRKQSCMLCWTICLRPI